MDSKYIHSFMLSMSKILKALNDISIRSILGFKLDPYLSLDVKDRIMRSSLNALSHQAGKLR